VTAVAAVSMVRDEADIVESTVRQMASQVDFLIVADNRSVDGTREILDSLATELPLSVVDEPQRAYYQSQTINALAGQAAEKGAEWIVPFDADEWCFSPHGRLGDVLAERPEALVFAASHIHVPTSEDAAEEPDPIRRLGWRERSPDDLPKVACRVLPGMTISQGNHVARYGRRVTQTRGQFAIRHFPYRSPEQFERKIRNGAAAIAATAFVSPICAHWREYGIAFKEGGSAALRRAFRERHYRDDPRAELIVDGEALPPLIFDPAPLSR
jgi:glycosyltransferase involved in cell wall biosynthesis